MSISQVQGHKWPVVSLPQGPDPSKELSGRTAHLERFEEIVACFDMDEPGQSAAQVLAELLPQGKVKLVTCHSKMRTKC